MEPVWPGGATGPPKDEPDCGFNNEKCVNSKHHANFHFLFFCFFFVNSILNKVDVFWHEHLLLLSKYKTLVVKSKYVFGDRDQVITKNANIISRSQITVNMDFHKHFHLILSNVIFRRFACTWYCWYHSWCRGYSSSLCHLSYLQVYNIDHHNISWHYY